MIRLPAECPAFEALTDKHAPYVRMGDIVETWPQFNDGGESHNGSGWLACETVIPRALGEVGYRCNDLRPLTRSARQMLALVKP